MDVEHWTWSFGKLVNNYYLHIRCFSIMLYIMHILVESYEVCLCMWTWTIHHRRANSSYNSTTWIDCLKEDTGKTLTNNRSVCCNIGVFSIAHIDAWHYSFNSLANQFFFSSQASFHERHFIPIIDSLIFYAGFFSIQGIFCRKSTL